MGHRSKGPTAPLLLEQSALLAALLLVAADAWLLRDKGARLVIVSAAVILLSAGLLAAILRLGLLLVRLAGPGRFRRAMVGTLLLSPPLLAVSFALFAGTGMASRPAASWGPYAVGALLLLLVALGLGLLPRLAAWARRVPLRFALAPLAASAGAALAWLDRVVYPNQYRWFHWLLLLATTLALMTAAWLLLCGRPHRRWHWLAPGLLAASAPAFAMAALYGVSGERGKQALKEQSHTAGRLAEHYRSLLDGDGDGHSVIFGGADCDDSNPAIHPLAEEIPLNGIDENCDGRDAGPRIAPPRPAPDAPIDADAYRQRLARWRVTPAVTKALEPLREGNVLLLVIDALRGSMLAPRASNEANHPTLMRLARQGRTFTRAFSPAAGTDIGMSALLTGRIVPRTSAETTMMRALSAAGLLTHAVFQREVSRWLGRKISLLDGLHGHRIVVNDPQRRDVGNRATSRQVTDAGIGFLRANRDRRFFLWLHYFDLHEYHQIDPETLEEPERFRAPRGLPFYRSLLRHTDEQLRRLLDELAALGLADRTLIVTASDHGEGLAERPRLPQNHGDVLFNELVHVGLSFRVPGIAGARVATPASLIDVLPTVLDAMSLPRHKTDGVSLLPFLLDVAAPQLQRLVRPLPLYEAQQRGVILWPWKLLVSWEQDLTELYHLERDFAERNNLADEQPEQVAELGALLNRLHLPRVDRLAEIQRWRSRQRGVR